MSQLVLSLRDAGAWLVCALLLAISAGAAEWRMALPGWEYVFPRDHRAHPDFKTEWWYFTGHLHAADGRRFGYQLTFFRQGLRPPGSAAEPTSRFIVDDFKFAHFALTDVSMGRFRFEQKLSRGAFGEAGFGAEDLAWIGDWRLRLRADGSFGVEARMAEAALSLELTNTKPWVVHGEQGVSQKAAGEGRASHYYSGTRLRAAGTLRLNGQAIRVQGESWLDREWASNQLTAEQVGWNWLSTQLDDGSELMLYQMRTRDGGLDPMSSGTFIAADGTSRHLRRDDYQMTPRSFWTSKQTGGRYPIAWDVTVPALELSFRVTTPVPAQELHLQPVAYWEGLIDLAGERAGKAVRGHGYLELTGYAGELVGLAQ